MRSGWFAFLALAWAAPASAQPPAPTPLESGREIRGSAATPSEGGLVGCYAIATSPGERLAVALQPAGFDGEVRIARGALCHSPSAEARRTWTGSQLVSMQLSSLGGFYVVVISRNSGAGAGNYSLVVNRTPASGFAPVASQSRVAPSSAPGSGSGFAPPDPNARNPARQEMLAQLERGEIRTVGAEDLRRRAEREAEDERIAQEQQDAQAAQPAQVDVGAAIVGGFTSGFNQQTARANESMRQIQANNRRIQAEAEAHQARQQRERARLAAEQARTAEQRRIAQQQMAAAQQRAQQARQQQQMAAAQARPAPGATGAGPDAARPGVETIAMLEGVVVCPLNPDRARLFAESTCHGPFQNVLSRPDSANEMGQACGGGAPRDLGIYGNHRVWGCGYGINPRRSGSPNIDQAQRFGLIIPSRRTFHCRADIDGYCRN